MSDDYKKDVKIDFFNLHLAYRDQAKNYMDWAEKWANADTQRDQRRRFLRVNIRKKPEEYGLPSNPSVAAANAAIEEDEEYIRLTYQTHIYRAAMDAMYQVRYNIDGLVRLYLNGYFSGPHPATQDLVDKKDKLESEKISGLRAAQTEGIQKSKRRIGRRRHGDEQTSSDSQEPERGSTEEAQ